MKKTTKLITIAMVAAVGLSLCSMQGCEKKKRVPNEIIGSWTEANPSIYDDGIKDTITFKKNGDIQAIAYFNKWKYSVLNDSIVRFENKTGDTTYLFRYSFVQANEVVFYNFINRLVTSDVKNIHYIKVR